MKPDSDPILKQTAASLLAFAIMTLGGVFLLPITMNGENHSLETKIIAGAVATVILPPAFWVLYSTTRSHDSHMRMRRRKKYDQDFRKTIAKTLIPQEALSDSAIGYRFPKGSTGAAVFLDSSARLIHFLNCYVPKKYLGTAMPAHTCSLDELHSVFRSRPSRYLALQSELQKGPYGEISTIVLTNGKVIITGSEDESYETFLQQLQALCPPLKKISYLEHPLTLQLTGVVAGIVMLGCALLASSGTDEQFVTAAIAGAVIGGLGVPAVAWLADRARGV